MFAFHAHPFALPLPPGHRFPIDKYARLHARVAAEAGALGIELRRIGFPWSPELVQRSLRSVGATLQALRAAIGGAGVAVNLAGGTHHAAAARGGGYCVFNDAAVAARAVQAEGLAHRLLIVDLDVHQGDGTAEIFAQDPSVFTFSMHGARNYPAIKPPGDLDVALDDGCGDADYLDALDRHLPLALERAQADAVVYLAGADPFVGDRLGHLALSKPGLAERDRRVLLACVERGLPVAVAMAGGYAEAVEDIVDIHAATVRLAARFARAAAEPTVLAPRTAAPRYSKPVHAGDDP